MITFIVPFFPFFILFPIFLILQNPSSSSYSSVFTPLRLHVCSSSSTREFVKCIQKVVLLRTVMFLLDNRSNLEKFDHQNDQIESTQNDRCFPLDYLPFSQPLHSTKRSVGPSVKSLIFCQAQLESSAKNEKKIVQGENCWADTGRVKESMKGNPGPRDRRNDERNISRHLTSGASPGPRFSVSDWPFEKEAL